MYCRIQRRTLDFRTYLYILLCHYRIIEEIKHCCAVKRGKSVEILMREGVKTVNRIREWEVVL